MSYFRLASPDLLLPWYSTEDEDRTYKKILRNFFIGFLVLGLIVVFYPVKEKTREEKETLPPVLARVILEKKELPKPPPPKPKPKPKPEPKKPEPKPEPKKPEPKPKPKPPKPEPIKPKPIKVPPKPVKPQPTRQQKIDQAQRQAQAELNQVKDVFADLQNLNIDTSSNTTITKGASTAKTLDRNVIANNSRTSSGGINVAAQSRNTGGQALSASQSTQVNSSLANRKRAADAQRTARGSNGQELISRSEESIRKTMDRNKAAIDTTYQRALRKNPALEGRFVVRLVIQPGGNVSSASIVSSDLDDADLEKKILARIRSINFGAVNVSATTLNYTFDFFPQ